MTHQRRSKRNAGTTVTFTADTPVTMKKEQFLANRQNKQCFIFMLSEELKKNNCEVHHASGNADLLIVMKAVQSANSSNTVLVGDETYLLVLLCHHASIESHDLFLCPEPKKTTKQPHIWNIKVTKQSLGPDICQHIFFLYAVLGCDTTYRLHRIGKLATHFVNTLKYCSRIQLPSTMWHVHERKHWWYYTMETRLTAWIPFGISGSVRRSHQSRLMFIHECYHQTPGAAMYHSLREYLQVQE